MADQKAPKNFEEALGELEEILESLESGQLDLETSLKKFESGVKLTRECQSLLSDAERRIKILNKDSDRKLQDFEPTV